MPAAAIAQLGDRLGVGDVGSESATGHLVEFGEATGLPAIIIGKPAQGRSGHYARLRDGDQSVLTDQSFDLPSDRQGWLDRDVADIGEAEVVEIEIHHPDGERLVARKTSADDTNFELLGVAEGFEPRSDWTVNSLAGNLAALTLESVAPADGIDWTGATRFRLLTADGLNAEAALVETAAADGEGSEFWLRLEAGVYTTAVESGVDTDVDPADTEERAAAINDRVGGWAYRIPKYKFDAMVKRMDDLVQETATDSP